jgi:hypothetical protein
MNDKLQKILADAKVGKAEFDAGSYYVCSEGTMKTIIKSVVELCAEKARNHTLKSNGISEDYNGYTNVEKEIRKLYENSN